MNRWKMALLIFELVLFAIILILPQVELPEFAFRAGTAPVLVKANASAPPALAVLVGAASLALPRRATERRSDTSGLLTNPHSETLLSELCTLIC